ncbi:hypothetical protein HPP92_009430 [Vanilla planifolia]|uniref:HTH La-type RNA-binding domain-containing protein n=1 Tax=Vanilla planifolia TaxID=51239 RepID=A0A835RFU4_VANPL|nr:hypothetical protein HPP92_009430 [Vanilla planifolia]
MRRDVDEFVPAFYLVEYYFSDENLPNDKFLLKQMRKDKEGYVPIAIISSFRKMKSLPRILRSSRLH